MSRTIKRREFFKDSAKIGLAFAAGCATPFRLAGGPEDPAAGAADMIAVVTGDDFGACAVKAVDLLGGMKLFVPKGSKVALLPNVQSSHPGTFTKPEILRAVVRMCKEAGAAEVNCLSVQPQKAWDDTGLARVLQEEGAGLKLFAKDEANFEAVPIPGGKALKEARILKEFFAHDVLINMPITKDHAGNRFTGTMKNLMGLNSPVSNRTFHRPNWKTDPADLEHLDRSIVDLNTVVKPALNIVDAAEFIVSNGPFGPGELLKPRKVVAGTDRVAIDAYCCTLWGLRGEDIVMIKRGAEQGLGTMDLAKVKIVEAAL